MLKIAKRIKLFAFDLDGTLYFGNKPAQGAVELINNLKDKFKIVFFTNNSSKTSVQIHEKLNKMGFNCAKNEVYTSASLVVSFLKEHNINNLYVIGSKAFCDEIKKNGLKIVDNDSADNIIVGLDFEFNYNKIATALTILLKGGKFIACNEDSSFPADTNKYMPGCGAMVGAISNAAKKKPDFIIGKPNSYILSKISTAFKVKNKDIAVVGDSFESDIQMALNYNCLAILINKKLKSNKDMLVVKNLMDLKQIIDQ